MKRKLGSGWLAGALVLGVMLAAGAWAAEPGAKRGTPGQKNGAKAQIKAPDAKRTPAPEVKIEGPVRPVIGKMSLKPGSMAFSEWGKAEGYVMGRPIAPPEEIVKQGRDALMKWFETWKDSPEGQRAMALARFRQPLQFKPDGSFRVEGVPAGKFVLAVRVTEKPESPDGQPEVLGMGSKEFEVPETAGAAGKDAPLDLGAVEILIPKAVKAGTEAPDFKFKTLEGKELSLKSFRGKFVLLDFWATWCGPCIAEVPNFKALYEAYGKEKNFVMVSLSLDDAIEAPQEYVKKNGLNWVQGFLGKWKDDEVTKLYGVHAIPATFLIGPDGKVVEKGLRGEKLKPAVAKALGKE